MALLTFENVKDTGTFAPLAPGKYTVRVWDTNFVMSSSNNPMVTVVLETVGENGGRKLWDNFVINNNVGLQRLKQFVYAIGMKEVNLPDSYGNKDNPMQIVEMHGRECEAEIQLDPKDSNRNRVKGYKAGSAPSSAASPDVPW